MNALPHATSADDPHQALMARVALGDRAAFAALYRATSAQLFGVISRIAADAALAEEVLQEVYVTVWRTSGAFNASMGSVKAWLVSIARNRAIDALRRRAARPRTVSHFGFDGSGDGGDGDEVDALERLPSDAPGPADLLEAASQRHDLQRCMEALGGPQRSCLALAYYQGYSHAEVATHMSQPLGTVKSWMRRALLSLRTCLDRAAAAAAKVA